MKGKTLWVKSSGMPVALYRQPYSERTYSESTLRRSRLTKGSRYWLFNQNRALKNYIVQDLETQFYLKAMQSSAYLMPSKLQMLKAGVIWLIGTDGSGHNELASCVPSRRSMPINQMTSPSFAHHFGNVHHQAAVEKGELIQAPSANLGQAAHGEAKLITSPAADLLKEDHQLQLGSDQQGSPLLLPPPPPPPPHNCTSCALYSSAEERLKTSDQVVRPRQAPVARRNWMAAKATSNSCSPGYSRRKRRKPVARRLSASWVATVAAITGLTTWALAYRAWASRRRYSP
ncbi:hypothetical protein TYRP_011582 [Tyrophagus putrescentiae]|nr:hypothetical protein TYRP_011582 [Tyrophagus putrescentiae]